VVVARVVALVVVVVVVVVVAVVVVVFVLFLPPLFGGCFAPEAVFGGDLVVLGF